MTTSPTRRTLRLLTGLATTGLLTGGLACVGSAAQAADPSSPLGFTVSNLAAAPDGDVVAIGYSYDEQAEQNVAHAALVRDGQVVPLDGIPGSAELNTLAVTQSEGGAVVRVGGSTDSGAALWEVDLYDAAPAAEAVAAPEWNVVTAASGGDFPVLAGTTFDPDGNYVSILSGPDGDVQLAQDSYPKAVAANAEGTYVLGNGDSPAAVLWVVHGTEVQPYDIGGYPTAVVAAGDTAFVASETDSDAGDGIVHVVDTTDGSSATLDFGDGTDVTGLALSADGETVYAAVNDWSSYQFQVHAIPVAAAADYDVTTDDTVYANGPLGALAAVERGGLTTVFSSQYDADADSDTVAGFDVYGDLVAPDAAASVVGAPTTAVVGQTLTGQTGGWPEGTELSYGWSIAGGEWGDYSEGASLKLTSGWVGAQVRYRVTGVKNGDMLVVESAPVTVKAAPVTQLPVLPVTSKAVAKVSGTAKVGKVLKAVTGTWPKGTVLKVQWLANGKPVKGATKPKLKLTKKLKGKKVNVVVTGTKPGYAPKVKKSKAVKVK